jgi:hypothetical protein
VCPQADFSVRDAEAIRNSRLLKPTIVVAVGLTAGIIYVAFVVIALTHAGWL